MGLNALFIGSTGLASNATALDVVGNNLANLNTTGFKSQRVGFQDVVYQTLNSGSSASTRVGGTNPVQLGFGVGLGTIGSLFTQGNLTPTGRVLDAGLQGSGFFQLTNGTNMVYSRNGSFDIDSSGLLIDPSTGFRVQRFGSVGETTPTTPGFQVNGNNDIRVPLGAGIAGVETSTVSLQGNLSTTIAVGGTFSTAIQIYDSQSSPKVMNITFTKTALNTYDVSADVNGVAQTIASPTITFDNTGLLVSPATMDVSIAAGGGSNAQTVTLDIGTPGQSVGLTQFGGAPTATAVRQDGSGAGSLDSISFSSDGTVQGQFSNGRTVAIAQLAIAGFNNQGGLLRLGTNYFTTSPASGEALVGPAGSGGRAVVQGGSLEGSNVDVATEFAKLIIAQRGFQVNARTVSAANDTLQELANIIR